MKCLNESANVAQRGSLPEPSAEALEQSARLVEQVRREIAAAGGFLPFSRIMEMLLYTPGLGYYSGGSAKFGEAGDFVTAPELTPLFGQTVAQQVAQVLRQTGGSVLEFGAGTGKLARDVLLALDAAGVLPDQYGILDLSGDLRARQAETLEVLPPALKDRVVWLNSLPDSFTGVMLGNEVLDAMPVELISKQKGEWRLRGIGWSENGFCWLEQDLPPGPLRQQAEQLAVPDDYVTELCPAAQGYIQSLAERLQAGLILLVDYGFGASEYYHPQRNRGTLMCHYRHHAHDNPLLYPGLQDITAHADFSAVARAGIAAGLQLLGYTTQAHFLINAGITQLLMSVDPRDTARYLPLASAAQKLMSPAEMGELFKVIALGKGIGEPLVGFTRGDLSRLL